MQVNPKNTKIVDRWIIGLTQRSGFAGFWVARLLEKLEKYNE